MKSELDKKPVFGQTGNFFTESNPSSETGSKLLFGKPVAARSTETAIPVVAASQSGGGQENSGLMKPSLFGKPVVSSFYSGINVHNVIKTLRTKICSAIDFDHYIITMLMKSHCSHSHRVSFFCQFLR